MRSPRRNSQLPCSLSIAQVSRMGVSQTNATRTNSSTAGRRERAANNVNEASIAPLSDLAVVGLGTPPGPMAQASCAGSADAVSLPLANLGRLDFDRDYHGAML
jgi:hypothetical protein